MKEVVYEKFGGIDVLQTVEVPKPSIHSNQVLVKIKAVSINPMDWKIRKGEMKLMSGSKFPKRIGVDFAGIVEEIGKDVTNFKKGDEVFGAVNGMKEGALGEFVAIASISLSLKPSNFSFSQAASITITGVGAYQAMVDIASVNSNSQVLINGATGGVGMFAIQIAKQRGATVTAVSNTEGIEYAKKWGADVAYDYTKTNVLATGKKYDVIFDLSGKLSFSKAKQILKKKAIYINPAPTPALIIGSTIKNLFVSQKNKMLLSAPNQKTIEALLEAINKGLIIEVSKTFPFSQFKEAYQYAEKGGFIGKITIEF